MLVGEGREGMAWVVGSSRVRLLVDSTLFSCGQETGNPLVHDTIQ